MNDTLQFQSRHLLERFRFFNNKWADNATFQSDGLIARKNYFRDKALSTPMWQAKRALYKADPDAAIRIYASRFGYFNDKMERLDAILYRYYRTKGARAESREGVRFLRAFMVGRDTTSSYLNRNQLTEKYSSLREGEKFFPDVSFPSSGSGYVISFVGDEDTDRYNADTAYIAVEVFKRRYIRILCPAATRGI